MKRLLVLILLLASFGFAQTEGNGPGYHFPEQNGDNVYRGNNTFLGPITSSGVNNWTGAQTFNQANINGQQSVVAHGAKCDGATDDSAAFLAAYNALPSGGGTLLVPDASSGACLINSTVAFTAPVTIRSSGLSGSILTTANGNIIFTATERLVVGNVYFAATGAASGTAVAIKTLNSVAGNSNSQLLFNVFSGFLKCYWSQRTMEFSAVGNEFAPATNGYGLYLENLSNSDEGDSFVRGNTFAAGSGVTSILVASTSGLYIENNKFNGSAVVDVDIAPTSNNVGDYTITGNSFEGFTTAGVRLIGTTGVIVKTVITGNQFSSDLSTDIIVGNNAQYTTVSGNSFNDTNAANGIGVDVQTGSLSTTVTGNTFYQIQTAINSTANIVGQTIFGNRFNMANNATLEVTNFYNGGENDGNLNGPGSEKDFEVDRFLSNSSTSVFTNAYQLKGDCIVEVFISGLVQGVGSGTKYAKYLVTGDTTVTQLIAPVSTGTAFNMQVTASGGFTVIGIELGATGTSLSMQVRVKVTGYPRSFSKV